MNRGRARVLLLTPQLPYPPRQGTSIRNYHLLTHLAQHARVTLVTFLEDGQPAPERTPLASLVQAVHVHPAPRRTLGQRLRALLTDPRPDLALRLHSPDMHRTMAHLARDEGVDVLLVEGLEMAPYMETYVRHRTPGPRPRLIFDAHNAEYVLQRRAFETDVRRPWRWHAAGYSLIQWFKLRAYEKRIARHVDALVTVSPVDRENLRRLRVSTPIHVVPNGVDVSYYANYTPPPDFTLAPPPTVLFTGKMDYRPNVDAVHWFVNKVWPRVRRARPRAHFYIVGRSPHPRVQELGHIPGVVVTGEVEDVRPYLHAAPVYVVPLRVGGGTRLKLLEAMAARRPIVSTTLGAEGYPVEGGKHLLLADTPRAFGDAILRLLEDKGERERLGERALAFVRERYDWSRIAPDFVRIVLGEEGA